MYARRAVIIIIAFAVSPISPFHRIDIRNPFITSANQQRKMDSFFIRPERPEDIDAIFEVNLQAFGQDGEARLVNTLRNDGDYLHELSLVAVSGNRIIGHILFPPITIVSETAETAALALAPLAVHQDFQCLGIGAALIKEGLGECLRLGHRIVVVVGHPTYYPKFGFTSARDFGIHAPFPCPDEAFMALSLARGALDGIHGTVRYPVAFDTVAAHTS
jgi:putative acetyltransferase